jgi:Spy/CpxP family protein refolding chaperone
MKHWLGRIALTASVAGAVVPLAIAPWSGNAYARAGRGPTGSQALEPQPSAMLHQGGGLAAQALDLASLSGEQRTQIRQLVGERRSAAAPVRQANSKLLKQLADQVDKAAIDEGKNAPAVGAVDSAVDAAMPVQLDSLNRLHQILTPGQRIMLIDHAEARVAERRTAARETWATDSSRGAAEASPEHALTRLDLTPEQKSQVTTNLRAARDPQQTESMEDRTRAFLEAFRSDGFDAHAFAHQPRAGEHEQRFAEAVLPVLTPVQRTTFAEILRERAHRA